MASLEAGMLGMSSGDTWLGPAEPIDVAASGEPNLDANSAGDTGAEGVKGEVGAGNWPGLAM
jgi:hypothetical protein